MRLGACEVCPTKDGIIQDLRLQLLETQKSLLALTDARAYQIRYPAERPHREPGPPAPPPNTAARLRATPFDGTSRKILRPEEVEAQFDLEHDLERRINQG